MGSSVRGRRAGCTTYGPAIRPGHAARDCGSAGSLGRCEYHDWLIYHAAARSLAGGWFTSIPQPHVAYRQHGSNQIGVNAGWASLSRRLRQVWSGHALSQATIVADATGM